MTKEKARQCRYYRNGGCTGGPYSCGIVAGRYTTCGDWFPRKKEKKKNKIPINAILGNW